MSLVPKVNPNLVGVGGELTPQSILKAYRAGCFPWTINPVSWWSPDPRAIIEFEHLHISRSLVKSYRKSDWRVSRDSCFPRILEECALPTPSRPKTWITPEFKTAYGALHSAGFAHSLEVWSGERLVGGIYGVGIGRFFVAESMFHKETDAGKFALWQLVEHLKSRSFAFLDVQMPGNVTMQMGCSLIPRNLYLGRLRAAVLQAATF